MRHHEQRVVRPGAPAPEQVLHVERAAQQRVPEGGRPVVHVGAALARRPAVVETTHLGRGLLVARHVLGHLEVSELLLADARVDVDAANTHVTEVLLQRVQRLLRALERRDNGRDGAVAAEQPAEAVAGAPFT